MFKLNFLKNQTITADELNTLGYNLANTAITTFTDGTLYGVSDLNEITEHLINKGIKKGYNNECAVILTDTGVYIDSGLVFFECGATMEIDDYGINLEFEDSTATQYVYLFFDVTNNVGGARCTTELPNSDYVMLAKITDGAIDSTIRDVAYMKNASVLPNVYNTASVKVYSQNGYVTKVDVGAGYKKFLFKSQYQLLFLDFEDDEYYSMGTYPDELKSGKISTNSVPVAVRNGTYTDCTITYENEYMTIKALTDHKGSTDQYFNIYINIKCM